MPVSTPPDCSSLRHRRLLGRTAFAIIVALLAIGQTVAVAPAPAEAVTASSSLTVKWLDDTSSAKGAQPVRVPTSPHYNEMKNISVTVSQTQNVIDQAIRVEVSGFAGTKSAYPEVVNGQNFIQAMQCWGENPNAANFVQTCQWGGRVSAQRGNAVYFDNTDRVSSIDYAPRDPSDASTQNTNPFLTVDLDVVPGNEQVVNGRTVNPLLSYFGPSTTNEVPVARVGSNGEGHFDFETQSSIQAPHMGCGTPEHLRCWLVIVPRGTKYGGAKGGGNGLDCSNVQTSSLEYYEYGQTARIQGGSPVNPKCDYFDNRIVVPLDFSPTGVKCTPGSPEFRVSGSQFMISAMSSWQPSLCQTVSSTFSFSTNPDSIARAQLLDDRRGSPELIYSGYPVSSGELQTEDERTLLSGTALQYAPVAVSSVVIAFNAEFANGRVETLNITPRLMAKLLTQSYTFTVPSSSGYPGQSWAHLSAAARRYTYWNADPDFRRANPTSWELYDQQSPSIVLPGPSGADGIKQVWRWILADKDAVDFLAGKADPDGMTVNPYYLPRTELNTIPWYFDAQMAYLPNPGTKVVGQVGLDGAPLSLSSTPLDTFPKDDGTLIPFETSEAIGTSRYDSIQFAPYAIDYLSAARQAFRGDPNSKTFWDSTKLNDDLSKGAYVSTGVQDAGARFMIAVTDSANAARYGLTTAAIAPANANTNTGSSNTPVPCTSASMQVALSALAPTTLDNVLQVDPAKVGTGGYPLTMVTYAGVNLTKSTAVSRQTIANMLRQVTTTGQVSGPAIGELPVGYLPLTGTLQDQAVAAVSDISTWTPSQATTNNPTTNSPAQAYSAEDGLIDPTAEGGADPDVTTGVDGLTDDRTLASTSSPIERSGLAIALVLGLVGFIGAPILLRRRGFL